MGGFVLKRKVTEAEEDRIFDAWVAGVTKSALAQTHHLTTSHIRDICVAVAARRRLIAPARAGGAVRTSSEVTYAERP